jgi:hypothetical protein
MMSRTRVEDTGAVIGSKLRRWWQTLENYCRGVGGEWETRTVGLEKAQHEISKRALASLVAAVASGLEYNLHPSSLQAQGDELQKTQKT